MVEILKHSNEESYQVVLDETETIEIIINGASVFTQTVLAQNRAVIQFHIKEALADQLPLPA